MPVLHGGPYAIAPPGDAPGWDCAPAPPLQWGDWVGAGGRVDWEGWEGMIVDDRQGVFVSSAFPSYFVFFVVVSRVDGMVWVRIYRMI